MDAGEGWKRYRNYLAVHINNSNRLVCWKPMARCSDFELRIKQKTYLTLDAAGVVEYYAGRRMVHRLDIDLVVPFGGASYLGAFGTTRLGTGNYLQTELGFSVRF